MFVFYYKACVITKIIIIIIIIKVAMLHGCIMFLKSPNHLNNQGDQSNHRTNIHVLLQPNDSGEALSDGFSGLKIERVNMR